MNSVGKTAYIPLYGKSYVSKKGIILQDKKAEEIWETQSFPLKRKAKSKWLAYYMGMRSATFDDWLRQQLTNAQDVTVLHLGCGMDCRIERMGYPALPWYDVDEKDVIDERKGYFCESEFYHMIAADITQENWLSLIPKTKKAIVLMEGVSMYLTQAQLSALFSRLSSHFEQISLLMDCYTPFAAKMSKIKNPIHSVGVGKVYGIGDPKCLEADTGMVFLQELAITPPSLIQQLQGIEKKIFQRLYAGKTANKLYKLYEYKG